MHVYIDGTLIHLCRRRRHFHSSNKIVNITLVRYFIDSTHTTYMVGQGGGLTKKAQNVQEDSRCKGIQGITSKAEIKCVCLHPRSIINKKNELNIMVDEINPIS